MEITGVGSGIMIALAAALWLVYLVPSWWRRREFDATERNAVRLQQTLRVMAETAELPRAARAELTARSVVEQERLMRIERRRREQALRAVARRTKPVKPATRIDRVRRARITFSVALLIGVLGTGAGVVAIATGGGAFAWVGVVVAAFVAVSAVGMLGRLAPRRAAAPVAVSRPAPRRVVSFSEPVAVSAQPQVVREWTPVPVPKPLYLSADPVARAPSNLDQAREQIARAAAEAEAALRAAQAQATPITASGRFATMGRLDDADLERTDIDQVLARRRA